MDNEDRTCSICGRYVDEHDRPVIQKACNELARLKHAGPGHEQPIEGSVGAALSGAYWDNVE